MINIIICDDNVSDANKIEKIVKRYFNKMEFNTYKYNDYDSKFFKIVSSNLINKIYLLDIETPSMSGIDVARIIRKTDYSSVIIFLSGHDDLSRIVAKKNIMSLNFINKFDNLDHNLKYSLDLALSVVGKRRRVKFESRSVIYNIALDNILYVTRDTLSRKSIIVCDNNIYEVYINLKNVVGKLGDDFVQTHRACYVNKNRVKVINHKEKYIMFDNGKMINLVSKNYVGGVVLE